MADESIINCKIQITVLFFVRMYEFEIKSKEGSGFMPNFFPTTTST